MKKYIICLISVCLSVATLSSCLDDRLPQTNLATADQVAKADKAGLVNGLTQYLNTPIATYSSSVYTGIGYPEHMIWRDVMTADMPIWSTGYNYWNTYGECLYMGNYSYQYYYWLYYNYIIYKSTLVIQNCQRGDKADALYLATGLAYRAFTLFEMTRMYEFKLTGTSLDDSYYDKLKGLTVPIVNENTTEEMAKNNPRAPYYQMYRYILNDLQGAEEAINLANVTGEKNYASKGMVYGLLARFWLELGTRFERHPDDLAEQISHDSEQYPELGDGYQELPAIGITSPREAFEKAANYARHAINSGYRPVTQDEWFKPTTGFNTANSAWMWAILMSSSDSMVTYYTWESWVSFMCPEASWGLACAQYKAAFMADARLFSSISDSDWRKRSWIDPTDWLPSNPTPDEEEAFEETFNSKYAENTNLKFSEWSEFAPYISFKFHPGSGNTATSTTGNKVDIPLMRVEEMYFIEAEALAHTQGLGTGIAALENFINTYRYTDNSYACNASSQRQFEIELLRQKRIEFWGEGICLYDYKRLELPITRGYDGTNHPSSYQFNSKDGYVAPWTILYIPLSESQQNPAVVINPDPSSIMLELKY